MIPSAATVNEALSELAMRYGTITVTKIIVHPKTYQEISDEILAGSPYTHSDFKVIHFGNIPLLHDCSIKENWVRIFWEFNK